jgi:hypothetical protein
MTHARIGLGIHYFDAPIQLRHDVREVRDILKPLSL